MRKVYELDPYFSTGEATVQPVLLWGANGRPLREKFTKTASEASEYIQSVQPRPGTSIVLVLALGAYETYDLNRNGDGFNEFPYRVGLKPTCECCTAPSAWIEQSEILPAHYQSFEQYGKIYRHHQNKDPAKSCGDVIKAFWNPQMHRVELLLGIRNEAAPDLAERIADGEYPAVSMGCRIKYDVCTICGHRAPTRAKYCDHLKYSMRQVTRSGLRAGALNPAPRFFDISFVVKPADQTGYMLKKVAEESAHTVRSSAELGAYLDRVDEKKAALQKLSDIDKVVRGVPVDHKVSPLSEAEAAQLTRYRDWVRPALQRMPVVDDATLSRLAEYPLADVLSTLSAAGVVLSTPEFIKLVLARTAPGTPVSESTMDAAVAMQGHIFDLFAQQPQLLEQLQQESLDLSEKKVRPEIGRIAEKYLEKRSTISDYLQRALIPPDFRDQEPHWSDTLHVTDPVTGSRYQTTRGAARNAHDAIAKTQLAKMVGGAALLAGGYKVLASRIPAVMRPVALGAVGLTGYHALKPDFGPQYQTEEGVSIPRITELRKVSSETTNTLLPALGSLGLVAALGHDYEARLQRGDPVGDPRLPLHRRLADQLGAAYHEHPALGFLGNLVVYGGAKHFYGRGKNLFNKKFAEYLGDAINCPSQDSVYLGELDVDRIAEKIGRVLLG